MKLKQMMKELIVSDIDFEKIVPIEWYSKDTNRDQPIWVFDYMGHRGEVVFGGETQWSGKLDNSGRYGFSTADEAKLKVEEWIKEQIARNIETANNYLTRYKAITSTEGWAEKLTAERGAFSDTDILYVGQPLGEPKQTKYSQNLDFLKYTESGVIPDDFKDQASGYRAGWNDCLAAVKYTITPPDQV